MPVHDKPMVYYPLATLMLAGIREVLLITAAEDLPQFRRLLGDGRGLGIRLDYAVQERPGGLAEAFLIGDDFIGSDRVALALGDNLLHGPGLAQELAACRDLPGAAVFARRVEDPHRYGVIELDATGRPLSLAEKPVRPRSDLAVPGIYFYDPDVVAVARGVSPSPRGELEITAVNAEYLRAGRLHVRILGEQTVWFDTGTLESLAAAAAWVRDVERRTGTRVGCLEEIAWRQGWIDDRGLRELAEPLRPSGYGDHLLGLLGDRGPARGTEDGEWDGVRAGVRDGAEPDALDEPVHVGGPNIGSRAAFDRYVDRIFASRRLSNAGPLVGELERRLADRLGVRHAVAVANGTVGLQLAARALGLSGEVIVPSFTFVATAHALSWLGIRPVFADIDDLEHTLDPVSVGRVITPATTGILAVHLWGRAAPVEELQRVADEHGLPLLFDAAHAFATSHAGRMIGSFGRCEVFSFHATKFFNTFEGGAVTTDEDDLAERLRGLRNFGFRGLDDVGGLGTNAKLSEIAAAMGLVNLDELDDVVAANRRIHEAYRAALARVPNTRLLTFPDGELGNYQYVVVEVEDGDPHTRDAVLAALRARKVLARRYFWPGCHRMEPYVSWYPEAGRDLPATQLVADRVLVLPTGGAMSPRRAEAVVAIVDEVMSLGAVERRLIAAGIAGSGGGSTRPGSARPRSPAGSPR
jgi:glucose-1-phosphate thymidylyltransferase short form